MLIDRFNFYFTKCYGCKSLKTLLNIVMEEWQENFVEKIKTRIITKYFEIQSKTNDFSFQKFFSNFTSLKFLKLLYRIDQIDRNKLLFEEFLDRSNRNYGARIQCNQIRPYSMSYDCQLSNSHWRWFSWQ